MALIFISLPGPTGLGNPGTTGFMGPTGPNGDLVLYGATGPNGILGNLGPIGDMGVIGMTGLTGTIGQRGYSGPTGDVIIGDTGAPGFNGPIGIIGFAGMTGLDGDIGSQGGLGPNGSLGVTGPAGTIGQIGYTGPIGNTGNLGPNGDNNVTGPTGLIGNRGQTGLQGPTGIVGATGAAGNTGSQGETGNQGVTGNNGPAGIIGDPGPQGVIGDIGITGATGYTGGPGSFGPSVTGNTGDSGPTGSIGVGGGQGPTGLIGVTGYAGITGDTGSVGPTGTRGPTGYNSDTGLAGPSSFSSTGPTGLTNVVLDSSIITSMTGTALSPTGLQPFISYNKIDNYINVSGSITYGGTFQSIFGATGMFTLSVLITKDQLGIPTNRQINESASIGLYDLPVYYSSGNNFSINGRVRFQNITATTTNILFDLAKPVAAAGGTLGDLTFQALIELEQIVPLLTPQSFDTAITIAQGTSFYIPPDPNGAVGPSQIIPVNNAELMIYDKTTLAAITAPVNFNTFWGNNVFPTVGAVGTGDSLFDPWMVYDQFASKFVLTVVRIDTRSGNPTTYKGYVLMAISKTSTPTTLTNTDWDYYIYDRTQNPGDPTFPDYQKLGYDDVAYYISENNFTIANESYISSGVFALRKTNLTVPIDTGITYPCIPVQSYESTSNAFYCITHQFPNVFITAINKTTNLSLGFTNVTLSGTLNAPVDMAQPNQSYMKLDNEANEQSAVLRRNVTDRIWTTINASTPSAVDSYGNLKGVISWVEINLNNWPVSGGPIIAQQEIKTGDGNDSLSYGSVNVDSLNNMSIGCVIVSINRYQGIASFSRLSTDPLNTTRSVVPLRPGLDSYQVTLGGTVRLGDYSSLKINPSDNRTFYVFNQYATIGPFNSAPDFGGWGTSVISYQLDSSSTFQSFDLISNNELIQNITEEPIIEQRNISLESKIPKCSYKKL